MGVNHRHLELQNVITFLEMLITLHIKPWMEFSTLLMEQ